MTIEDITINNTRFIVCEDGTVCILKHEEISDGGYTEVIKDERVETDIGTMMEFTETVKKSINEQRKKRQA